MLSLEISQDLTPQRGVISADIKALTVFNGDRSERSGSAHANSCFTSGSPLWLGALATGVALIIGVTYGAVSGFIGGNIDNLMMRFVDLLYSLPFVFFVILLVVFFGNNIFLIFHRCWLHSVAGYGKNCSWSDFTVEATGVCPSV